MSACLGPRTSGITKCVVRKKKTYEGQRNFRGEAEREGWGEVQKDAISEGLGGGFLRPSSGGSE